MNNKVLTTLHNAINAVNDATTLTKVEQSLSAAAEDLPMYEHDISFGTTKAWIFIWLFVAIGITVGYSAFELYAKEWQIKLLVTSGLSFFAALLIYMQFVYPLSHAVSRLTKCSFNKMLKLRYGIVENKSFSAKKLREQFKRFPDGDRSNGFHMCVDSELGGIKHIKFEYFYETKHETTSTDEKGNTKTDVSYTSHYIHGLLLQNVDFPKLSFGFGWFTNKKIWHPTSPNFNKHYRIDLGNEIELAKYFTPARAEKLASLKSSLPSSFYLQSNEHGICISYEGKNLLSLRAEVSSRKILLFRDYLQQAHFHKYHALMQILQQELKIN